MADNQCSICLEAFTEPKGLPCFHTFCRECLQMFIDHNQVDRANCFNCPMCRAVTKPPDTGKPRNEWAKSFPTNNYVLRQGSSGGGSRPCPTHRNETLDISCKTCKEIICVQCCLGTHEKCEKTLTEINAKKVKNGLLVHLEQMREQHLGPLEKRLGQLKAEKDSREGHVKQMAQELLDYIGAQEKRWLQEIETAYSSEGGTLREQRENLVQIVGMAQESVEDIDNLVGVEDGAEEGGPKSLTTFDYKPRHVLVERMKIDSSALVQWREARVDFQISQDFIKAKDKLLKENMLDRIEIPPPAAEITGAGCDAGALASGGGVGATASGGGGSDGASATAGAGAVAMDFTVTDTTPRDDSIPRPFQFITSVNLGHDLLTGINDMVMLPDQCFLLTEACFKKVWKFSTIGEHMQNVTYDTEPYGLCILRDNTVAVSLPYNNKITILAYRDLNETASISFQKKYYGLASDNNDQIFALYREQTMCIDIISKNNTRSPYEINHVIKLAPMFYFCDEYRLRVLPSGNLLIITPASILNLTCLNQNGQVVFSYHGESGNTLSSVGDIAVSGSFIYIADKMTNKIHRIQDNGSFVDIPLTSNDGILHPKKIFLNNGGVLAVLTKPSKQTQIQLYSC